MAQIKSKWFWCPFLCVGDANTRRGDDVRGWVSTFADLEDAEGGIGGRRRGEVGIPMCEINAQGLGELGGAGAEIAVAFGFFAACIHKGEIISRGESTDEDGLRCVGGAGGDVHAMVHAVGEVDIGVAGRSPHGFDAWGAVVVISVGSFIVRPEIGFDFDDQAANKRVGFRIKTYEFLAE